MTSKPTARRRYKDIYITGSTLGKGSFAKVKRCTRISDQKECAVKIIEVKLLTRRDFLGLKEEIRILKAMKCRNILSIIDSFDNGRQIRLVLELCHSDDLFDRICKSKNGHFSEMQAARITCIIARTVKYLHEHFVVHRDLKPENILFTNSGVLKVSDYGLAHYLKVPKDLHFMHTCCGTPHYVAPEVLNRNMYTYKIDYWSIGVILYIMLCGFQPFASHSISGLYSLIVKGKYTFPLPYWANISKDAQKCVSSLMCVDVGKRSDADQLMKHAFIAGNVDARQLLQRGNVLRKERKLLGVMKKKKKKKRYVHRHNCNSNSKVCSVDEGDEKECSKIEDNTYSNSDVVNKYTNTRNRKVAKERANKNTKQFSGSFS